MRWTPLLERWSGGSLARRVADLSFGIYARHRIRQIERRSVAQTQTRTLLRLVRQAESTRFGQDHDFASIRTTDDFQRRVPLRDYDAFWQKYWQPAFPDLAGVSWPGPIPALSLSFGTTPR